MRIRTNRLYINKTWQYLVPALSGHGYAFTEKFSYLFKLAVGIGDDNLRHVEGADNSHCIFILIDRNYNPKETESFMDWVRQQSYYVLGYPLNPVDRTLSHYIVIVKLPEIYRDAYKHFVKGEYSKMYTREQVEKLFRNNDSRQKEYKILLKEQEIVSEYKSRVKAEFGVEPEKGADIQEYDLPPKKNQEIFFYKNGQVYF